MVESRDVWWMVCELLDSRSVGGFDVMISIVFGEAQTISFLMIIGIVTVLVPITNIYTFREPVNSYLL